MPEKHIFIYILHSHIFIIFTFAIFMTPLLSTTLFFLICGAGSQTFSFVSSIIIAMDTTRIRYVAGNELYLMWVSLAGILTTWCVGHISVSAYRERSDKFHHKAGINWLPIGAKPQIALWTAYIVFLALLAATTSALLYDQQTSEQFTWISISYLAPVISAFTALPKLGQRLCQATTRQRGHTTGIIDDCSSTFSLATTMSVRCPQSPGNESIISEQSGASDNTKCTGISKFSRDEYKAANPPSLYGGRLPYHCNDRAPRCKLERLMSPLFYMLECRVLAVFAAMLSIAMYSVLCHAALQQRQHTKNAPTSYATLVSVVAAFPDNIDRTVRLSISCKGVMPPEFITAENTVPQKATIIIEHMTGYPSLVSRSIQQALVDQSHRVCIYDRPGYMLTPQGYSPIPPSSVEQALLSALKNSGERGPFYVVGHHSGSENAQLFVKENRGFVVGMALIYPTDIALQGLLSAELGSVNRTAISQAIGNSNSLLLDTSSSVFYLNYQRALASLGIWSTEIPIVANPDNSSDAAIEWALESPNLAQAQYFERAQRHILSEAILRTDEMVYNNATIPVIIFGAGTSNAAQAKYLSAISKNYAVEISSLKENQPLALNNVARQIAWHISRLI